MPIQNRKSNTTKMSSNYYKFIISNILWPLKKFYNNFVKRYSVNSSCKIQGACVQFSQQWVTSYIVVGGLYAKTNYCSRLFFTNIDLLIRMSACKNKLEVNKDTIDIISDIFLVYLELASKYYWLQRKCPFNNISYSYSYR